MDQKRREQRARDPVEVQGGLLSPDELYLRQVGETVRKARLGRGMTRKALAQSSGVSERYLAELETGTGNASLLVLRRIARAIGLDVVDLVRDGPALSVDYTLLSQQLENLSDEQLAVVQSFVRERFESFQKSRRAHIALIGLRGAGKTTLGRSLAERRRVPFIELDREIERVAGMEIAEIFSIQGQPGFRKLELDCLQAIFGRFESSVIATGGSLVTSPKTYELLLSRCTVIWLKARPAEHMERVLAQGDTRPMADNPQAMDDLKAILDSRIALYAKADAALDTSGLNVEQSAIRLAALAADLAGVAVPSNGP